MEAYRRALLFLPLGQSLVIMNGQSSLTRSSEISLQCRLLELKILGHIGL